MEILKTLVWVVFSGDAIHAICTSLDIAKNSAQTEHTQLEESLHTTYQNLLNGGDVAFCNMTSEKDYLSIYFANEPITIEEYSLCSKQESSSS